MQQEPHDAVPNDRELRDRPLGELLGRLGQQLGTLVRQEADLAKAEIRQKTRAAGPAAGMFGAAAAIGLLAGAALTACAIAALAIVWPVWLAALVVGVVEAALAAGLAMSGRARLREAMPPVPHQTIETVKEDVAWAKSQRRSA